MALPQCPQCSLNTYDLTYLTGNYLHLDVANILIERQAMTEDWNADQQAEINRALGRIDVLESRRVDFGKYVDTTFRQIGLDVGALRETANIQSELILALQEFTGFGADPSIPPITGVPTPTPTGACAEGDIFCGINQWLQSFAQNLGGFALGTGFGGFFVLILLAVILLKK